MYIKLQSWEKIVGTPDAITIIPMLTTEIENGACHCSVQSSSSHFYQNPSPSPLINVGESGKASDTIGSTLCGGEGSLLLLRKKCVNKFFHDCSITVHKNLP